MESDAQDESRTNSDHAKHSENDSADENPSSKNVSELENRQADTSVTHGGSSVDLVKDSSGGNLKNNMSAENSPDLLADIPSSVSAEDVDKTPCESEDKKYSNVSQLSKQESSSTDSVTQKVTRGQVENYDSSPYDESSDSPYVGSSSEENEPTIFTDTRPSQLPPRSKDDTDLPNASRPDSLSLPRPLQFYEKGAATSNDKPFQRVKEEPLQAVTTTGKAVTEMTPEGTITREGDRVEFVAMDLQRKIKMSSPQSSQDNSHRSRASSIRTSSSLNSISSMSTSWSSSAAGMSPSTSFHQDTVPPIDPRAVHDLEVQACLVGESLDAMLKNLKTSLHKMSSLSVDCVDAYKNSVDKTCDSVDSSIKAMYALMAKCEELSYSMAPVYALAEQIKEIKRLLDLFESQLVQS